MGKGILKLAGNIKCNYGRISEVDIRWTKCEITNEKTWCIWLDSSEGEYGGIAVSIKHVNEKLNEHIKNNLDTMDEKRELNIYRQLLINLHTARWTGHTKKVNEILDAIGAYSYARTNTNEGNFEQEEIDRLNTLIKLENI